MPMAPKTLQNLKSAFHAETGVYFKYTLWADRARKAGHHAVGTLFDQVARNEWAHAKIWYKRLNQEMDTQEALLAAAGGEHHEWSEMYAQWADEARDEGELAVEKLFRQVAAIEAEHEGKLRRMAQQPEICPVCEQPQGYFARQ